MTDDIAPDRARTLPGMTRTGTVLCPIIVGRDDVLEVLDDALAELAKGRGRALSHVWSASDADILAYMDVDLSTDLRALLPLVAPPIEVLAFALERPLPQVAEEDTHALPVVPPTAQENVPTAHQ